MIIIVHLKISSLFFLYCLFKDAGNMRGIRIMDMKWEEYEQAR